MALTISVLFQKTLLQGRKSEERDLIAKENKIIIIITTKTAATTGNNNNNNENIKRIPPPPEFYQIEFYQSPPSLFKLSLKQTPCVI